VDDAVKRALLLALVLLGGACSQWRAVFGDDAYQACVAQCKQEDHAFCERDCKSTGPGGDCSIARPGM